MADETGKSGSSNPSAPKGRRARPAVARTPAPGTVVPEPSAAVTVIPEPPVPAPVPAILAAPAAEESAPAPVVVEAAADVPETPPAPAAAPEIPSAAPAAPLAEKEDEMNETVTSFAEKAQEQTKTAFANVGEQTRGAVEKGRKVAEDIAEFGKGNVEALVESARIAAQGFETLGHDAAAFARARYDSTASVFQTLASVKSPTELVQIQAEFVRSSFDAVVKEASRSTEATLKLAGDVAKPLQNRLAVAADKFRTAA